MAKEKTYCIGKETFIERSDWPLDKFRFNLSPNYIMNDSYTPTSTEQRTDGCTGVLHLPLSMDDPTFKAYQHIAPALQQFNIPLQEIGRAPVSSERDLFIYLVRLARLNPKGRHKIAVYRWNDSNLELIINSCRGNKENSVFTRNYIKLLKSEDINAESAVFYEKPALSKTTPSIIGFGAVCGGIAGITRGSISLGLMGALMGGVFGYLACAALSNPLADRTFYSKILNQEFRDQCFDKINQLLTDKRAKLEVLAEESKKSYCELGSYGSRLEDLKRQEIPILEYEQAVFNINRNKGLLTEQEKLNEKKTRDLLNEINALSSKAGKIFDLESHRPGLIIRYTAPTPQQVESFIEQFANGKGCLYENEASGIRVYKEKDENVKLLKDYELLEKIGSGGIGIVYKAKDKKGNIVTVKVPADKTTEKYLQKPKATVDILLGLSHPNIVRMYHANEECKEPFEVREYVEGQSLDELICKSKVHIPNDQVLNILCDVAKGLDYAHKNGLLHQDLKPQNILLTRKGTAKITDFDLVKTFQPDAIVLSTTLTGEVIGSIDYIAPERRKGKPATVQSDIYSFGAIAFELLAGGIKKSETVKPLSKLNPSLQEGVIQLVEKCLETNPEGRYESMQEVLQALNQEIDSLSAALKVQAAGVQPEENKAEVVIEAKAAAEQCGVETKRIKAKGTDRKLEAVNTPKQGLLLEDF